MEIKIAKNAGFCFGVKRAVNIAFKLGKQCPNTVFTLGPIIHNPQVVKELEKKSIHMIDDLNKIDSGTMIVRSHGLPPNLIKQAKDKGIAIVDATCPFVKKVQKYALSLMNEGYPVLLIGDKDHPEVIAIRGYLNSDIIICSSPDKIDFLKLPKKLGVVAQTTQDYESFKLIISKLINNFTELKIYNTICDSTIIRQKSALKLAREVELMIVIGGKNSANTNRLANICNTINQNTYLIETPDEVNKSWFIGIKKLGITAGASTPKWMIDKVIEKVKILWYNIYFYITLY